MSETAVVSVDLRQRRIMLFGDVDESSSAQIVQALLAMDSSPLRKAGSRRLDPIEFWISSHGGSINAAHAICDVMRFMVDADIVTVGTGRVCSAAVLPLLFGDFRTVLPSTEIVIHNVSQQVTDFAGRPDNDALRRHAHTCETAAKMADASNRILVEALTTRAGWDLDRAELVIADGLDHVFFGADEILAAGLADGILNGKDEEIS